MEGLEPGRVRALGKRAGGTFLARSGETGPPLGGVRASSVSLETLASPSAVAATTKPWSCISLVGESVSNRCHPLQHPKRTRFRPFWPFPGAFFSFLLVHGRKIFGFVFVQVAICWLQIEVVGDSTQPGCVLLDIVQLRYLRGGVAQQFENLA